MVTLLSSESESMPFGGNGRTPAEQPVTPGEVTADDHEALLQLTQALFCSLELSGHVRSVSQTWCEKTGFTQAQVIGNHFLEFVQEEDAELCQEEFRRLLTGNPPRDCAARLNCVDGSVCWMNLKPSVNRDGGVIYILATDITVDQLSEKGIPDPNLIIDQVGQGDLDADAVQAGMPIRQSWL